MLLFKTNFRISVQEFQSHLQQLLNWIFSTEEYSYLLEWIIDNLLTRVQKSDILMKKMNDPRFMQAMQEFQTDPSAAIAKYSGDSDMELFLKEFCSILGNT